MVSHISFSLLTIYNSSDEMANHVFHLKRTGLTHVFLFYAGGSMHTSCLSSLSAQEEPNSCSRCDFEFLVNSFI